MMPVGEGSTPTMRQPTADREEEPPDQSRPSLFAQAPARPGTEGGAEAVTYYISLGLFIFFTRFAQAPTVLRAVNCTHTLKLKKYILRLRHFQTHGFPHDMAEAMQRGEGW